MSLSALIGLQIGIMIDPLIWGVVLAIAYLGRNSGWRARVGISAGAVFAISLMFMFGLERAGEPAAPLILLMSTVGAVIWSLLISATPLFKPKRSPAA